MYRSERSDKLIKILKKLFKKDKSRYEAALNKIWEISNSEDPHHYKNLSHDMKDYKRVHIDSHFVLIFHVDEGNKTIRFSDLQHHDFAYKRGYFLK
ncbi:type II toxin-antitoxin system mRNA interferase toxin, RelE/StbE family [Candidatus Woesearchaeota archaeon]|nr:type II toxin-antitoxin system mRNA interferase toxin, RelE/StbE family [Candidatus Woesearchaeota archaeon]